MLFLAISIGIGISYFDSCGVLYLIANNCCCSVFAKNFINKSLIFRHYEIERIFIPAIFKNNFLLAYNKALKTRVIYKLDIINNNCGLIHH